mgnify:CR=1 FL=1
MYCNWSTTAQRGALDWAPKFKETLKPVIEDCYQKVLSGEEAKAKVKLLEPRIRDSVNVFLSSLTPAQLSGYDGIRMLRQEIWNRANEILEDSTSLENIQILKLTIK